MSDLTPAQGIEADHEVCYLELTEVRAELDVLRTECGNALNLHKDRIDDLTSERDSLAAVIKNVRTFHASVRDQWAYDNLGDILSGGTE